MEHTLPALGLTALLAAGGCSQQPEEWTIIERPPAPAEVNYVAPGCPTIAKYITDAVVEGDYQTVSALTTEAIGATGLAAEWLEPRANCVCDLAKEFRSLGQGDGQYQDAPLEARGVGIESASSFGDMCGTLTGNRSIAEGARAFFESLPLKDRTAIGNAYLRAERKFFDLAKSE